MKKQIKPIDANHIAVIETTTNEQLIAKVTLEARRGALSAQIADIDDMLTYFK